ncbi:hypothetical protein ACTFIU_005380 [Dictyostelium citrinum]
MIQLKPVSVSSTRLATESIIEVYLIHIQVTVLLFWAVQTELVLCERFLPNKVEANNVLLKPCEKLPSSVENLVILEIKLLHNSANNKSDPSRVMPEFKVYVYEDQISEFIITRPYELGDFVWQTA